MNASTSKTWTRRRRLFWSWKGSATINTWLQTMSFLPVERFILGHSTEVLTYRLLWCDCFKTNSKLMMVASDFFSKIWLLFWQPGTSRNPLKIFSHTGLVWLALLFGIPTSEDARPVLSRKGAAWGLMAPWISSKRHVSHGLLEVPIWTGIFLVKRWRNLTFIDFLVWSPTLDYGAWV